MIVDGKCISYDLSRFSQCKIKRVALCDLMQIPDFVSALESEQEFDISDAWIADIAAKLVITMRITSDEKSHLSENEIKLRKRWQSFATNVVKLERKILEQ